MFVVMLVLAALPVGAQEQSLEELRNQIRATFSKEYASRDKESKRALARKLLETSRNEGEESLLRVALCMEARDLARATGDVETGLEAVREISTLFGVGGLDSQADFLDGLKRRFGVDSGVLLGAWLDIAEEALAGGDYELAERAASRGNRMAGLSRDSGMKTRAKEVYGRVREIARKYRGLKAHLSKLELEPDDPEANAKVGEFTCFVRGDWEAGLPMLSKGGESVLTDLAKRDLAAPTGREAVRVGDGWWNLGTKSRGNLKDGARGRAIHWYELALGDVGALDKIRLGKRISDYHEERSTATRSGGWPGSTGGIVFAWGDARSRNEVYDPVARRRVRCTGRFRDAAKVGPRGEMVLGGGSFLVEGFNKSLLEACKKSIELFVEAAILPDNVTQHGPARIITFSSGYQDWNFTLGQEKTRFGLRLGTSPKGYSSNDLCPVVVGKWQHVIATYRPGSLACYVNGKVAHTSKADLGDFSKWKDENLVLGDEFPGKRDWSGSLRGIVIGSRFIDASEASRRFKQAARFLR